MEGLGEELAERGRRGPVRRHREIEAAELEDLMAGARGRDAARHPRRVVLAAALRIAERLVSLGNAPEHRLGRTVTRIHTRVIPARQPPIRALHLRDARAGSQAKQGVVVHGSRFSVLGSRFSVLGSWFLVLGSWFLV